MGVSHVCIDPMAEVMYVLNKCFKQVFKSRLGDGDGESTVRTVWSLGTGDWGFVWARRRICKTTGQARVQLVLAARRLERLQRLALALETQYGVQTKVVEVDFAHPRFMDRLNPILSETDIGLAILNAGFSVTGEFLSVDMEQHERLWRVNCNAPLQLSHTLGRQMVKRGRGGIIIVSSSVAFSPIPYWTHYAATKAYSLFLGEGLAYSKTKG
jgi:short-subunit dehydrogenase